MRKFAVLLASLATLSLGGCADVIDVFNAGGVLAQPAAAAPAPEKPAPVDVAAIQKAAVCAWAESAGIPKLTVATLDSGATKRSIASLHGSYKTSCPAKANGDPKAAAKKS